MFDFLIFWTEPRFGWVSRAGAFNIVLDAWLLASYGSGRIGATTLVFGAICTAIILTNDYRRNAQL